MYVSTHKQGMDGHAHVTVERGFGAGTWEVRYEPAGSAWRVRSPAGREVVLGASEPWLGESGVELEELMGRIARRAVAEALRRELATRTRTQEEPPKAVRAVA